MNNIYKQIGGNSTIIIIVIMSCICFFIIFIGIGYYYLNNNSNNSQNNTNSTATNTPSSNIFSTNTPLSNISSTNNTQSTTNNSNLKSYPPTDLGKSYTPVVNGLTYGNGTYTIKTTSERNGSGTAAFAFSLSNDFWQINPYNKVNNNFSNKTFYGDYVQIQLPSSINIISYSIKTTNINNPLEWALGGSNDESTWTLLDYQNFSTSLANNQIFTYSVTSGNYKYFRFVYLRSDGDYPVLQGLKFNSYTLTTEQQVQQQNNNTPKIYPPLDLPESYSPTINGQSYGNGTYNIQTTAERNGPGTAANAFNTNGKFWQINPFNKKDNIFSGQNFNGDYVQIQLPNSITVSSYKITTTGINNPIEFVLGGSTDGNTWTLLDHQNVSLNTNTTYTYNINEGLYSYFRFVYLRSDGTYPVLTGLKFIGY
jgi:hypothetical protein